MGLGAGYLILYQFEKWKMVMSGSLNVECMTIGGVCRYKKNYDDNLERYIAMSNFGYKYQALQKVNNSN